MFMRRKIIKQGNNSFTLTLPIKWVKENSIEKQNEVEVDYFEKDLILKNLFHQELLIKIHQDHKPSYDIGI